MAEATQYTFQLREVAEILVKAQNIRSGKWLAAFEISMGMGMFGAVPTDAFPGAFMQIKKVLLIKAESASPEQLIVDAAEVWDKNA